MGERGAAACDEQVFDLCGHKHPVRDVVAVAAVFQRAVPAFGMVDVYKRQIQPGESQTAAVRAVFFVDPEGKLRAMIYYPLALGRNFEEIKRVLVGLQSIDAFGVAMPADWRPGDEVIVPMQGEDMDDQPEGVKCYDWFFCTRPLPKEEIEKKLGKGIAIKG